MHQYKMKTLLIQQSSELVSFQWSFDPSSLCLLIAIIESDLFPVLFTSLVPNMMWTISWQTARTFLAERWDTTGRGILALLVNHAILSLACWAPSRNFLTQIKKKKECSNPSHKRARFLNLHFEMLLKVQIFLFVRVFRGQLTNIAYWEMKFLFFKSF